MGSPDRSETELDRRASALVENFDRDYPAYQYAFVNFLVDHLADLSRAYRGDFQQIVILAIIGQRWLNLVRNMQTGEVPGPAEISISASRLADVTGIPRETVRRKLALMQGKGWVTQGTNGNWSLVIDEDSKDLPVRRDHAEFDRRARRRVARLVAMLEKIGRPTSG